MYNLVFLGPPGAGKGTQAEKICSRLGLPHISTGDMLRSAIRNETEMGLKAKAFMDKGELVPDDVVIGIVRERLAQDDCKNGYILDGFPRTIKQAEALSEITVVTNAINITVEDEKLVTRLSGRRVCPKCGHVSHTARYQGTQCPACGDLLIQRDDDKPETIRNRLSVYNKSTFPLIEYYKNKGVLVDVDGYQDVEAVDKQIIAALEA